MFNDFYLNVQLLSKNAKIPTRGTKESAGIDFYTPIDVIIPPNNDVLIALDIRIEMPAGYMLVMKEKSGIATKKKLDVGGSVIDSDYRGCIHCHLFNNSDVVQKFAAGDKVCQGVVVPVWIGNVNVVDTIETTTERCDGGFGSTGER